MPSGGQWVPVSKPAAILLFRYERLESLETFFLNPDWNLQSILFSSTNSCVWSWITFLMILDIKGRNKIGWEFLGSVLEPFLSSGFNLGI